MIQSISTCAPCRRHHDALSWRWQHSAPLQAGLKDGQRDTRQHCPEVTAEGLPEDPPVASADGKAGAEAAEAGAPYEEGCFMRFEVQGDVPEAMPVGAALRALLGGPAAGLAHVQYQPVRAWPPPCSHVAAM